MTKLIDCGELRFRSAEMTGLGGGGMGGGGGRLYCAAYNASNPGVNSCVFEGEYLFDDFPTKAIVNNNGYFTWRPFP